MTLPSRPATIEIAVVLLAVLGTATWLGFEVGYGLAELSAHGAALERARSGEDSALDEAQRFAARNELVSANLRTVEIWLSSHDHSDADGAAARLADAVEALVESSHAGDPDVSRALERVAALLDDIEETEGLLDPDLALARELVADVAPQWSEAKHPEDIR